MRPGDFTLATFTNPDAIALIGARSSSSGVIYREIIISTIYQLLTETPQKGTLKNGIKSLDGCKRRIDRGIDRLLTSGDPHNAMGIMRVSPSISTTLTELSGPQPMSLRCGVWSASICLISYVLSVRVNLQVHAITKHGDEQAREDELTLSTCSAKFGSSRSGQ